MIADTLNFLFTEVFEGKAPNETGTYFVQSNESLFETLAELSAEQASHKISPSVSTIAAHTSHVNYYLWFSLEFMHGRIPHADWDSSWATQTVTEEEWQAEITKLREQTDLFKSILHSKDFTDRDNLFGAIANITHASFHLGAIRQIFLAVKDQTN